jgi:hypothetical protein
LLAQAFARIGWIDRSAAAVAGVRERMEELRERWSKQITIQAREQWGVPSDVWQKADAGDRDAMKDMMWQQFSREASPEALASSEPWTFWLYRMLGGEGDAAFADLCGAVDAAENDGRIDAPEADCLRTLVKRFIGPGEIEAEHIQAARQLFAEAPEKLAAVELLQLYDWITSGERTLEADELFKGIETARAAGATGLVAFLSIQLGAQALNAGDLDVALELAQSSLQSYEELTESDSSYGKRLNMASMFLYNVAYESGDVDFAAQVFAKYGPRIEAYAASQRADREESSSELSR